MNNLNSLIKQNKLVILLLFIIAFLLLGRRTFDALSVVSSSSINRNMSYESSAAMDAIGVALPGGAYNKSGSAITRANPVAPQSEISDRMVVQNSYLSLVVQDVTSSLKQLTDFVVSQGGYMVNSNISRPEEGGTATLTVRVPADALDRTLENFKSQSVKVVSQNLTGSDVTDQYVNNEERLRILERNKQRFEEIMASAEKIDEILRVQNEIFSLQSQIDSIKGQQEYLKKTSEMALMTVYLSTDELALPFAPAQAFRPELIFKQAVRHLMGSLQSIASLIIWAGVYSIMWVPVVLILLYIRKRSKRMPL